MKSGTISSLTKLKQLVTIMRDIYGPPKIHKMKDPPLRSCS